MQLLTPALLAAAGFPAALLPAIDSDTIIFSHARPDGTLEFMVPKADEPKSAFALVWHPADEATWDYHSLRFYVKEERFRGVDHTEPLGGELVSLRHDGDAETVNDLAEWLDTPEPATPPREGGLSSPPGGLENPPLPASETERRRQQIVELARQTHQREGEVEIDADADLSEGDDNGCYVAAWVWVSFAATPFDKGRS